MWTMQSKSTPLVVWSKNAEKNIHQQWEFACFYKNWLDQVFASKTKYKLYDYISSVNSVIAATSIL